MKLLGDDLEFFEVNCSVLVLIEKGEDSSETVLGLSLTNLGSNDINELVEPDGFVLFSEAVDELEDEGISFVQPQFFEDLVDLNGINAS